MRIGLDARILGHPTSGIAVYVLNLVEQFLKCSGIEMVLFGDRPIWDEYRHITDEVEVVIFGQEHRKRWSQVYLPAQLKKFGIDLYHATWNNAVPIFASCPSILTVHDIIPLAVSGYFKNTKRRFKYISSMKLALRKARAILTDSECTRTDLIKFFDVPEDKIKVVYLAVEDRPRDVGSSDAALKGFGIDEDYIINVGSFDPRRNAQSLIKAFAEFVTGRGGKAYLVLTGGYNDFADQVRQLKSLADSLGLHGKVIFTGYVAQGQMAALVSNARLLVHPSLYEGFCLPVLEAMNYGVAAIASNRGSIPEVVGDAALLVNPTDVRQMAAAIERLWEGSSLSDCLVEKGRARLKDFSWEKAARQTLDVYRSVCQSSSRRSSLPLSRGHLGGVHHSYCRPTPEGSFEEKGTG